MIRKANKTHKFIVICLGILIGFFIISCSSDTSTNTITSKKAVDIKLINEKITTKIDCNNQSEYKFVVVENPNREKEGDAGIPRDLNIVIDEKIIAKIELPKGDTEAKNFSLNSVEKDKVGFEIKVDWGGGIYHYEIQYNFRCKENNFFLYSVKMESFSTKNPDSGNFLDEKETKIIKIKPNLAIEKFVMTDYLQLSQLK